MKTVNDGAVGELCISDLVIMSAIRPAGRTTDMEHGRNCHGFLFLRRGEARFWEKGNLTVILKAGELLYIPKGHKYTMQYTEADTMYVLLNFELLQKSGEELVLVPEIAVLCKDSAAQPVAEVMTELEYDSEDQSLAALLRRKELAYRLLYMVYRQNVTLLNADQRDSRILPGILMLKQSYLENIPVPEFAKACNISVSLFRTLFREQYGVSPVHYRNELRISRARQLLMEGSCTVAEAAYASGFENIGYFCNYYKKVTGERPTQTHKGCCVPRADTK